MLWKDKLERITEWPGTDERAPPCGAKLLGALINPPVYCKHVSARFPNNSQEVDIIGEKAAQSVDSVNAHQSPQHKSGH